MLFIAKILSVVLCVIPLTVCAEEFIRTEAWGPDEDTAVHNAFVTAIETKVGILLLSDRETKNYNQVKNDVYAYSAGYITEYKVISESKSNAGITVIVDSKVATSKIKNRILIGNQSSSELNGSDAIASFSTYNDTKISEDNLLKKVLLNYPTSAYNVELDASSVKSNVNRVFELAVGFHVSMNPEFISSARDIFSVIDNSSNNERISKVLIGNSRYGIRYWDTYYIDNNITRQVLYDFMVVDNMRVNISLQDENKVLYSTCVVVDPLITMGHTIIEISSFKTNYYSIQLTDKHVLSVIKDITKIELSVVDKKNCTIMEK